MQVVLRQDVEKLGLRGELVNVARGYARNYLLPRGLAEAATPGLVQELERREAERARHEAKSVEEGRAIASRLEALELRFDATAGPTGSLFGSVTATNIADRLWEQEKIRVDRRKLAVEPIKRIGRYVVPVELFGGRSRSCGGCSRSRGGGSRGCRGRVRGGGRPEADRSRGRAGRELAADSGRRRAHAGVALDASSSRSTRLHLVCGVALGAQVVRLQAQP